jgi:hypothetical protein
VGHTQTFWTYPKVLKSTHYNIRRFSRPGYSPSTPLIQVRWVSAKLNLLECKPLYSVYYTSGHEPGHSFHNCEIDTSPRCKKYTKGPENIIRRNPTCLHNFPSTTYIFYIPMVFSSKMKSESVRQLSFQNGLDVHGTKGYIVRGLGSIQFPLKLAVRFWNLRQNYSCARRHVNPSRSASRGGNTSYRTRFIHYTRSDCHSARARLHLQRAFHANIIPARMILYRKRDEEFLYKLQQHS